MKAEFPFARAPRRFLPQLFRGLSAGRSRAFPIMQTQLIDISKLDKAEVLAALYNASKQQGMGFMHRRGASGMTKQEAQSELEESRKYRYGSFDYLHGRVIKIELAGDAFNPRLYDRDNGEGAAARAIASLAASHAE